MVLIDPYPPRPRLLKVFAWVAGYVLAVLVGVVAILLALISAVQP